MNTPLTIEAAIARLDRAATLKDLGRHAHYARTVTLASEYTALATAQNISQFLVMFKRREDSGEFAQREALTVPKTSSLLAPAINQFQRTSRLQNIKRDLTYDGKAEHPLLPKVRESMDNFYGESGMDEWVSTIYDWVSLIDPNSYAVVEFEKPESGEILPYPVVYFASEVYETGRNKRKQLQYLLGQPDPASPGEYVLYAGEFSMRYTMLPDREKEAVAYSLAMAQTNIYAPNPVFQPVDITGKPIGPAYLRQYYETKCPFVQAERMGYLPDPVTSFETCVSALEPAKYVLIDHVRTGSNFDLSKYLHVFPQKVVAATPCSANGCNLGEMPDGSICTSCKGTGISRTHTQPTDTIEIPYNTRHPENMPDLSKFIQYVQVEMSSLDALDKNLDKLANAVYVSIFNNQLIQSAQTTPIQTATEFGAKRDNENNTLSPFVAHKASIYRFAVRCQAVFVSDPATFDVEKLGVVYEPPKDLVIITREELNAYLAAAVAAGMPPMRLEKIIRECLEMDYEGDPDGLEQLRVRMSHIPFMGLTWDMIQALNASGYIRKRDMVLLAYQDSVFFDLERDNSGFYGLKYPDRDKLIKAYIDALMAELPDSAPVQLNMGKVIPMPTNQQTAKA